MTTTVGTGGAVKAGTELARLAIRINDFSGPTYQKYFNAFLEAAFIAPSDPSEQWVEEALSAFDEEISRLGAKHDLF